MTSQVVSSDLRRTNELLRKLIIVQLTLAGVGQRESRSIVGGDMAEINSIAKLIRKSLKSKPIK